MDRSPAPADKSGGMGLCLERHDHPSQAEEPAPTTKACCGHAPSPGWQEPSLGRIEPVHVREWVAELTDRNLSPSRVGKPISSYPSHRLSVELPQGLYLDGSLFRPHRLLARRSRPYRPPIEVLANWAEDLSAHCGWPARKLDRWLSQRS